MSASRLAAGAALLLALVWALVALRLESFVNRVGSVALAEPAAAQRALHDASFVADLHADSLLFGRDLRERSSMGHTDLPRLREGGVALQIFGLVTRVPLGMNIERNAAPGPLRDSITWLGCAQLSRACIAGPFARLEMQAERLAELVEDDPELVWVRSRRELDALVAARPVRPALMGAMLGIEGAHALEGDPQKLERAFDLGVRMIGPAHFFDNDYAGSAHGTEKGGLSELGLRTLRRMEELGIAVDVAHLSERATAEWLALATKPVVVSHGGVRGTCDNARTVSDSVLDAIAAGGGVVGIGYWELAVCGTTPADIARAARYVVDRVGDDHVALGSDYDGGVKVPFDASRLAVLTAALHEAGLGEASIRKALGGNVLRVLSETLPPE